MLLLVKLFAIAQACMFVQSANQRDKLFFVQKASGEDTETLLVVTWSETEEEINAGCEFFTDKDLINEVLESSSDSPIRTLTEDEMQNLLEDCTEFNLKRRRRESDYEEDSTVSLDDINGDPEELAKRRRNSNRQRSSTRQGGSSRQRNSNKPSNGATGQNREARRISTTLSSANDIETTTDAPTTAGYDGLPVIFPGTKWCGAGDRAKNYDDLGLHQDTDRCCRAHDHCNDTLAPKETRNNLTNKSPFTKLSCQCDDDFYDCLNRVNTVTSNSIGNMYFNVLRRECYKMDYPLTKKCLKYRTLLKLSCLEYERDTKAPKEYQWVSAKKYKRIPFPGPLTVTLPF